MSYIMSGDHDFHYYEFVKDHTVIPHLAIRTEKYKLIYFYTVNEWEL